MPLPCSSLASALKSPPLTFSSTYPPFVVSSPSPLVLTSSTLTNVAIVAFLSPVDVFSTDCADPVVEKDRKGTTSTSGATAPPDPSPPLVQPEQQPYYGTFQGVACFTQPPPQPVIGFPQPAPPPGATILSNYYARGYQTVPGIFFG
uniref:Uncharacterized protein n=1 Tax=Chenopodium quinoa TaxID=63459 RepID=A0A803MIW7_CHEQI